MTAADMPLNTDSITFRNWARADSGASLTNGVLRFIQKGSYYSAQYRRIAARRGRKRAAIAVAHSQLVTIYHLLRGSEYEDLGADHFDKLAPERLKRNPVARLEHLGYKVNLEEMPAALASPSATALANLTVSPCSYAKRDASTGRGSQRPG